MSAESICELYMENREEAWHRPFEETKAQDSGWVVELQQLKPGDSIAKLGPDYARRFPFGLSEDDFLQALSGLNEFSGPMKGFTLTPAFATFTETMEQLAPTEGHLSNEALRKIQAFLINCVGISDGAMSFLMRHGVLAPLLRIAKRTTAHEAASPIIRSPILGHFYNPHRPLDSETFLMMWLTGQSNLLIGATAIHRDTLVIQGEFAPGQEVPDGLGDQARAIQRLAPAVCGAFAALGVLTALPFDASFLGGGVTAPDGSVHFPTLNGIVEFFFSQEDLVGATYEHLVQYLRQNGYPRWVHIFGRPQDRVGGRRIKEVTVPRLRKRSLLNVWEVTNQQGDGTFVYRFRSPEAQGAAPKRGAEEQGAAPKRRAITEV